MASLEKVVLFEFERPLANEIAQIRSEQAAEPRRPPPNRRDFGIRIFLRGQADANTNPAGSVIEFDPIGENSAAGNGGGVENLGTATVTSTAIANNLAAWIHAARPSSSTTIGGIDHVLTT